MLGIFFETSKIQKKALASESMGNIFLKNLDSNTFTTCVRGSDMSLYLSPPHLVSVGLSCLCTASFPWRRSPTVKRQSSTHHSVWYSDLKSPPGGSIDKGTGTWLCQFLSDCWQRERAKMVLAVTVGQRKLWHTIVQGFRSCPLDRDLSESSLCRVHAIILLTGHPEVTDLHHVMLCNQTVSRSQVPLKKKRQDRGRDVKGTYAEADEKWM